MFKLLISILRSALSSASLWAAEGIRSSVLLRRRRWGSDWVAALASSVISF